MVANKPKVGLLGLGLDGDREVVRVTRGENFHLVGGSDSTHKSMQEKCIKFNEKLQAKGKQLEQLERQELLDIAQDCQMNVAMPKSPSE